MLETMAGKEDMEHVTISSKDSGISEEYSMCLEEESDTPGTVDVNSHFMCLQNCQDYMSHLSANSSKRLGKIMLGILFCGYLVYLGFAICHSVPKAMPLIVLTPLVLLMMLYVRVRDRYEQVIINSIAKSSLSKLLSTHKRTILLILYPSLMIVPLLYMSLNVLQSLAQLVPLAGVFIFTFVPFITSKHITRIKFRPVMWAMGLQFTMGVMVLRWKPGFQALKFLSDQLNKVLSYSLAGAAISFGDPWLFLHPFVFLVTSMVIFIGGLTSFLLNVGVIQIVLSKIAWLMRHTIGTTAIESVSLIGNIFFQTLDLIQMFRTYIPKLTKSEFHTFSVGCHASIAGFAYGLFVLFGVNPQHLLTASLLSAPAAIAISKLNYPETEETYFKTEADCQIEANEDERAVESIANGAWQAAKMVITLMVQMLVFMSGFEWIDATIVWVGDRVGLDISLRIMFSYMFTPFAYIIGVDQADINKVSSVVGLKLTVNEIVAFMELGQLRRAGAISERSAALTTYAICGFSSFGTLSMMIHVWGTVNKRVGREALAQMVRIYFNGNMACFLTASIAGVLYSDSVAHSTDTGSGGNSLLVQFLYALPTYKDILKML